MGLSTQKLFYLGRCYIIFERGVIYLSKLLEKIKSFLDDNGKVLVTVGDFGEEHDAKINRRVVIHCVYISKSDRMHHSTLLLLDSPDKVAGILKSIKQLVSPFYFISDISDDNFLEFEELFPN